MSPTPRADDERPDEEPTSEEEPSPEETPSEEVEEAAPEQARSDDVHVIDLVPDEMALARGQLDAGLALLAEGTVRRRLARLEADGASAADETDALRVLLAEALWRQGRLVGARHALDGIRAGSPQRRLPIAMLVEADALAAAGERDRATGVMERVVAAIGVDAAHELRGDRPGPLAWPLPSALAPQPPEPGRAPWAADRGGEEPEKPEVDDDRVAAARGRLEEARVAYVAGALERGDDELAIATRLDPSLAADGGALIEPTLGGQPAAERLLLYGDLLRAAGREVEANEAYDRAAGQRS
ncbi:MAG TPA: hypothetical protein VHR55_04290 [Candidatus Limnocylindria bacterium]|nr:hypothetical protein [Candidatus Limnocylindria bacterium]